MRFWRNKKASMGAFGSVIAILVAIIIGVLLVYNIAANTDLTTAQERQINENRGLVVGQDAYNNSTTAANATSSILSQAEVFFQIAPILAIVIVAILVLAYVGKI